VTADSTWENYYIVSPYGLAAVIVKESGAATTYYAETDHLGSLIGLMNSNGTHAEKFSFDAWGRRRNPADWSYSNVPEPILTERGFTGHEHMDLFGLINMNGRIYDPVAAKFLNADPVIQNQFYSQNLNGYSYCFNNPLRYKDPQGFVIRRPEEITWIDFSQVYASAERLKQGARYDDQFAYSYSAGMYFDSEGNVIPEREVMSSMTSDNFAFQITDPINLKLDISSKGFYLCFGSMTPQERIGEVGNVEFEATFSFTYTLQFVPYSSSVPSGNGSILGGSGLLMGTLEYNMGSILHDRGKYDVFTTGGRQLNTPNKTVVIRSPIGNINDVFKSFLRNAGKTLKGGGFVTFGVSTYFTAEDTYTYYSNGGTDSAVGIKAGIDTIMGVVGFFGPIGLGISATYFISSVRLN
jgi:RHS repeat-associated protein